MPYRFRSPGGKIEAAFGHFGLGGSLVFCDPSRALSIAVTVNKLQINNACTKRVVELLADHFGLGSLIDVGYDPFAAD
jgi:CubicO group peptidase (beta-lactamase class C family)